MGTNFYLKLKSNDKDKREERFARHIGKRSAAGYYCFDCEVSLCKEGSDFVHWTKIPCHMQLKELGFKEVEWFDKCPICGQSPEKDKIDEGSVGIELGFNKNITEKKKGVKSCSSFSWGILPYDFHQHFKTKASRKRKLIVDEYGLEFTYYEFNNMLNSICPIQSFSAIGIDFT